MRSVLVVDSEPSPRSGVAAVHAVPVVGVGRQCRTRRDPICRRPPTRARCITPTAADRPPGLRRTGRRPRPSRSPWAPKRRSAPGGSTPRPPGGFDVELESNDTSRFPLLRIRATVESFRWYRRYQRRPGRTRRRLRGSAGPSASGEHGPQLPHPRWSLFDHAERGGVATFMIYAVPVEEVDVGEGAMAGRAVRPLDAVPTSGAAGAGHRQPSRLVVGHHRSVGPPADRKSMVGRDEPDDRVSRRRRRTAWDQGPQVACRAFDGRPGPVVRSTRHSTVKILAGPVSRPSCSA
jgi:hypothetical protein